MRRPAQRVHAPVEFALTIPTEGTAPSSRRKKSINTDVNKT